MENNQQSNILDSYESTENALMDSFKAAALKVTTLYKDSLIQNRKAYASGYQQALQDLYGFLLSVQPENGAVSVQDVLAFAREKHKQLNMEMNVNGGSGNLSQSVQQGASSHAHSQNTQPPPRSTNTTNATATAIALEEQQQQQQKSLMAQQLQSQHNNPFQIDPNTQFTFTQDMPSLAQQQQQFRSVAGLWGQATNLDSQEYLAVKRRVIPSELTFMGRSLNVDLAVEPPFKRGRLRREEQLQQQLQLQQQQQQQHQLYLQQQQHQQDQLQQQQFSLQQQEQQQQQGQSTLFHPPS